MSSNADDMATQKQNTCRRGEYRQKSLVKCRLRRRRQGCCGSSRQAFGNRHPQGLLIASFLSFTK